MKTNRIKIAGLGVLGLGAALSIATPVLADPGEVHHDNREIHRDNRELHQDRHDVHAAEHQVQEDRHDVIHDATPQERQQAFHEYRDAQGNLHREKQEYHEDQRDKRDDLKDRREDRRDNHQNDYHPGWNTTRPNPVYHPGWNNAPTANRPGAGYYRPGTGNYGYRPGTGNYGNNGNYGGYRPGNSYNQGETGIVTSVHGSQAFDVRIGSKTYNVYTTSGLPYGLSNGDTVRVAGTHVGGNDIRNAHAVIVRNR